MRKIYPNITIEKLSGVFKVCLQQKLETSKVCRSTRVQHAATIFAGSFQVLKTVKKVFPVPGIQ
jgi:hypothetical protein